MMLGEKGREADGAVCKLAMEHWSTGAMTQQVSVSGVVPVKNFWRIWGFMVYCELDLWGRGAYGSSLMSS